MNIRIRPRLTVDAYLAWAEDRPGRYELIDGEVVAMSPERFRHSDTKVAVLLALRSAIARAGLSCRAVPDGMTLRIDAETAFEPDAAVYCGPRAEPEAIEIPNPVIVVEILSPSTKSVDTGKKFAGYFNVATVMHYLVVDAVKQLVIHHRRGVDGIETRIVADGTLQLDPPGLAVPLAEMFDGA